MVYASRDELMPVLNELLEAERAGAKVTLASANEIDEPALKQLMLAVHRDEAHWCAVLLRAIARLGGEPSQRTGDFYERCMAIVDMTERMAFLNRGQGWVARKLKGLLPTVGDAPILADLTEMLTSHEANIGRVAERLPPAAPASR